MRVIVLLFALTILGLDSGAQDKIFNHEVATITENDEVWHVPKGQSFSFVTASESKGQMMYMMVDKEVLSTGRLILLIKSERKEMPTQHGGYTMVYSWDRTTQDKVSLPTKVTMRAKFTNAETKFSCELETSKGTYIYQGAVYDISKPQ